MNVVIWRKSTSKHIYSPNVSSFFKGFFFNRIASADSQNHHRAYKKERNISRKIEGNWGENVRFSRTNGHEHLRPDVWLSFAYFYDTTTSSILLNIKNTERVETMPPFFSLFCSIASLLGCSSHLLCTYALFQISAFVL